MRRMRCIRLGKEGKGGKRGGGLLICGILEDPVRVELMPSSEDCHDIVSAHRVGRELVRWRRIQAGIDPGCAAHTGVESDFVDLPVSLVSQTSGCWR